MYRGLNVCTRIFHGLETVFQDFYMFSQVWNIYDTTFANIINTYIPHIMYLFLYYRETLTSKWYNLVTNE